MANKISLFCMYFADSWIVLKRVKIDTSLMTDLVRVRQNKFARSSADSFCVVNYNVWTPGRKRYQRYFARGFCVLCCFVNVIFANTGNKCGGKQAKLSRKQVNTWLQEHPKSPWWISNDVIVNFCRIQSEASAHNTAISGKFVPRKQSCWQYCPGMWL